MCLLKGSIDKVGFVYYGQGHSISQWTCCYKKKKVRLSAHFTVVLVADARCFASTEKHCFGFDLSKNKQQIQQALVKSYADLQSGKWEVCFCDLGRSFYITSR